MTKLTVEQICLCQALEKLIKAIVNGRSYNDDLLEDVVLCVQKMMDKETALRDQFAMAALTGLLSDPVRDADSADYAECAYEYADAMLEARKEKK
jgi:hypothetical protein